MTGRHQAKVMKGLICVSLLFAVGENLAPESILFGKTPTVFWAHVVVISPFVRRIYLDWRGGKASLKNLSLFILLPALLYMFG